MVDNASGSGEGLKLEPHMIPKLQAAFKSALDELSGLSQDIRQGHGLGIEKPAMQDGATLDFRAEFNKVADEATTEISAYQQRLHEVVGKLEAIQKAYDQREYDTAAELSSQLEP